jgi:hypothetical protein
MQSKTPHAKQFDDPELMDRCRHFWHRQETDRPLVGVLVNRLFPLQTFSTGRNTPEVHPADVTVEDFLDDCERRHQASQEVGGDAIFVAYARIGLAWYEAIMGCPIYVQGGASWAEPFPGDWKDYTLESVPWENGWFDKLQELTQAAVEAGDGRYPVGPTHLRSPLDLASALLGAEQLCLSMYDHPQELHNFLNVCTEVWLKIVRAQYDLLPVHAGGYWNGNQPLWAPGKTMFVPADAGALISPRDFEMFAKPYMERLVRDLPYSILHTHSSYLHYLHTVLDIEQLRAVQVGIDDGTHPDMSELLPKLREIQEKKALIVAVAEQDPDIGLAQTQTVLRELPARGLCILRYLSNVDEGQRFISRVWEEQ